jgi:hypothetical protein
MLGTIRPPWGDTLRRITAHRGETRVSYSPRELNEFIDTLTADAVAARLRDRADWHTAIAEDPWTTAEERERHLRVAAELAALAERELQGVAR